RAHPDPPPRVHPARGPAPLPRAAHPPRLRRRRRRGRLRHAGRRARRVRARRRRRRRPPGLLRTPRPPRAGPRAEEPLMSVVILYAIPAFIVLMLVEGLWLGRERREAQRGYERRDTAASLAMGIGHVIIEAFTKAAMYAMLVLLYRHRFFTMGTGVL